MIKQVVFLKKRPDMTMEEFVNYYEQQHSQLSKRLGAKPPLPNAQRYVRRYITPEKNPLTGEVIHPGYDCIMEIWWNSREDFEAWVASPAFREAHRHAEGAPGSGAGSLYEVVIPAAAPEGGRA